MSQQQHETPDFEREYILVKQTDSFGFYVGERILYVHHPDTCAGDDRPCCIHKPSDHHMRSWPQLWRGDGHFMERLCAHMGHPDPDDLHHAKRGGAHGCDGCCNPPTPEVG